MKKIRRNSIIVFIITIIILILVLRHDLPETISYLKQASFLYLMIAFILYIISLLFDSLSYKIIIHQYKKTYKFKKVLKLNLQTKFFNGITPLSTGGQPLQIYTLHKEKLKLSDATSSVIEFNMVYQVALIIVSTFFILLTLITQDFFINNFVRTLLAIGFFANIILLLSLILISFNKKVTKKITRIIIKILSKLRFVKDKEKCIENWDQKCENFNESARNIKKNKGVFVKAVVLQIIQLLFQYSIPLFLVKAIGCDNELTLLQTIISSTYVFLIGCFVPIPGASGGMEYAFKKCFSEFVAHEGIHATIILWRLITYIIPVVTGGILFNIRAKEDKNMAEEIQ